MSTPASPDLIIEVLSAAERDVDLLLVRDLADGDWLLGSLLEQLASHVAAVHRDLRLTRIARSVMTSDGESDLELDFESGDGRRLRLLIENKIDAIFQPRQAERYTARATRFGDAADSHEALTLLVAPEAYAGGQTAGFDARVNHEWFLARYRDRAEHHAGARYGVAMLEAALDRSRTGYVKAEDQAITAFWRAYWEASMDAYPDLRMPEPEIAGASNVWIAFQPVSRPTHARVLHKLDRGVVHLQFGPGAMPAAEVRDRLGALADDPRAAAVSVVPAGRATAWERQVPPLDPQRAFAAQREAAIAGMQAADELVGLFEASLAEDPA